jgi:nucleotide-binding universal stress UspA family protein
MVTDVDSRLIKLGRFQLTMAQERAAAEDVVALGILRQGHLQEELVKVAVEIGATLIVFGRPLAPTAAFGETALEEFVAELQADTKIEVRIVETQ